MLASIFKKYRSYVVFYISGLLVCWSMFGFFYFANMMNEAGLVWGDLKLSLNPEGDISAGFRSFALFSKANYFLVRYFQLFLIFISALCLVVFQKIKPKMLFLLTIILLTFCLFLDYLIFRPLF